MPKQSTGSLIVLHRRLALPCFPEAEAGPAAIVDRGRRFSWAEVGMVARSFMDGSSFCRWAGVRRSFPQSVSVISPSVPDPATVRRLLEREIAWERWDGCNLSKQSADVLLVWQPLQVLPWMTPSEAAHHLVDHAFGGGGVYAGSAIDQMEQEREVRRG
jgi:hypothetical protein